MGHAARAARWPIEFSRSFVAAPQPSPAASMQPAPAATLEHGKDQQVGSRQQTGPDGSRPGGQVDMPAHRPQDGPGGPVDLAEQVDAWLSGVWCTGMGTVQGNGQAALQHSDMAWNAFPEEKAMLGTMSPSAVI